MEKKKLYTTKTASIMLGIKQDTVKRYAWQFGIGVQPGGYYTPHLFTDEDIETLRQRLRKYKKFYKEKQEVI